MGRPFPTNTQQPRGDVDYEQDKAGKYMIFFTPPNEAISNPNQTRVEFRRPIMIINPADQVCTIFPYTVHGNRPMSAKYWHIEAIAVEYRNTKLDINDEYGLDDFLSQVLPSAFSEDHNYGLGFKKNYRPIIALLESLEVKKISITLSERTRIDKDTNEAIIKKSDLDKMCRAVDRVANKAQKVSLSLRKAVVGDLFFELLTNGVGKYDSRRESEEIAIQVGLTSRFITGGATTKEQNDAIEVVKKNGRKIMSERPEELIKLKNNLELVSLEGLIERFQAMFNGELKESQWQKLFNENPFILNMALGVPIVKVQGQASMGGIKFSGSGNKIADFLVKNHLSNNSAIVEIKTPNTKLLSAKPYRGGIYGPSNELNGAVSQILDQIHLFQRDINTLKASSKQYDIESYAVHGVLIVGITPVTTEEQKSFELFRGNSKSIQIITFDELLQKLKDLYDFLKPADHPREKTTRPVNSAPDEELPF